MASYVGRTHTKDAVLRRLARSGLRVSEEERGGTVYQFIVLDHCKHAVGNKTLGMLDYLARVHNIHSVRTQNNSVVVIT